MSLVGLVVAISSTAGITGQEFCTAYAAAKFGVEGWIESLTPRWPGRAAAAVPGRRQRGRHH